MSNRRGVTREAGPQSQRVGEYVERNTGEHFTHHMKLTVTNGEKFLIIKGRELEVKARIIWCLDCDKMASFEIVKSKVLRKALDRLPK